MAYHRQKRRLMCEINVVPYIDVMLVLLVIFMITAPLLNQGVNVDLPQAKAHVLKADQEPIVISVNSEGKYFININKQPDQVVSNAALVALTQAALAHAKSEGMSRPVLVKGDRHTAYGDIMKAMVLLQQAGVTNIGLMTQDIQT
jgi:biopolymer transport protein TolR